MSTHKAIDTVKKLAAQYSMRQPWYNDSLCYLSSVIYAILNQKDDGTISCLLVAVDSARLQEQNLLKSTPVNPGVYRLTLSVAEVKATFSLLRNNGYVLVVYKFASFAPWVKELDALTTATKPIQDPYDLIAINKTLPLCHTYVELFGGGVPMLYARSPSPVEVCNDRGSYVTDFAKSLRQTDRFNCFFILSRIFPFSLPADTAAIRRFVQSVPRDDYNVTRSFAWYSFIRMVYSAAYTGLGEEAKESLLSGEQLEALQLLDPYLPRIHGRLLRVQYENNDYVKVINTFDSEHTLFWVDVPVSVGHQDDTVELDNAVKALNGVNGAVALYIQDGATNVALAQCIAEGCLVDWKATKFNRSTVYTRNVRTKRS